MTADTLWQVYAAQRFLAKYCGAEVTEAAESTMGFSIEEAITVLLSNRGCYEVIFVTPRAESKLSGGSYLKGAY